MNAPMKIDIFEATRLTREGRLEEAMAVLRGTLPGVPGSADAAAGSEKPSPSRGGALLDMIPPSSQTGGAWTAPEDHGLRSPAPSTTASRPAIAKGLREALARIGKPGTGLGLEGLVRPGKPRIPAPLPQGARFETHTFSSAAGSRAYKLYVPSGYSGQALPLVVMLHGCTQSPDDFAAGTRMNEIAEEQSFLVAYPEQDRSANPSKCWNWFSAADQRRDGGEPALIAGIAREIMREWSVEPERVYVAGLSAGGAAAAIMAATYPDLFAAVGVHSGLACGAASDMPSAFAAMRQGGPPGSLRPAGSGGVPTIVFHGDRDTTVNPVNADQVIAQSWKAADLQATVSRGEVPGGIRYVRTVQADENGRPVLEQWVLQGAGHAWSGGSPDGSYTEPRGPDASREMVRFFLQHVGTPAPGR